MKRLRQGSEVKNKMKRLRRGNEMRNRMNLRICLRL